MRAASLTALLVAGLGAIPLLALLIAGVAAQNGCPADRGDSVPCVVWGVNFGPVLADLAPIAFLSIVSWPLVIAGLGAFILLQLVARRSR